MMSGFCKSGHIHSAKIFFKRRMNIWREKPRKHSSFLMHGTIPPFTVFNSFGTVQYVNGLRNLLNIFAALPNIYLSSCMYACFNMDQYSTQMHAYMYVLSIGMYYTFQWNTLDEFSTLPCNLWWLIWLQSSLSCKSFHLSTSSVVECYEQYS